MNKEGFTILSAFKRLPFLLLDGVVIQCDQNLTYMFGANRAPTSKAVSQCLHGPRVFLGQLPHTIVHIHCDENCWGDLPSDAAGGSGLRARERQMHRVSFRWERKFPTKEVVRDVQAAASRGGPNLDTASGVAPLGSEGLYCEEHDGDRVIWVQTGADSLKKRLLVYAHLEGAGHRRVEATMARLDRHCVWDGMADDVRNMVRLCMYCTDTKEGLLVPLTLEETPRRRARNAVVHLFFPTWGRARWTP